MVAWLADRVGDGGSVLAVDRDVSLCRPLGERPNVRLVEAELETLSLEPATYDLVHTRNVLMHVDEADRIIGEANNGGDFIEELLRTVDENVPYRTVTASRGKQVRAEPISAIYEQGRAHHVGTFPILEDQLCSWTPLDRESPDRLDALVWGMTELTQNMDWTTLYNPPWECPRCRRGSLLMKERPRCPHCGQDIPPALLAALLR